MLDVRRVDFVSVPVRDRERACKFDGETIDTGVCHNYLVVHRRYAD